MTQAVSVTEALLTRRSVRAFQKRDVDEAVLRRLIDLAARAPSGGNLQPWHLFVLKGEPMEKIRQAMEKRVLEMPDGEGIDGEAAEYRIYPSPLVSPYKERRHAFGHSLYDSLSIARDDTVARRDWHHRNFRFFDAPAALFFYVDRSHGSPQWSDIGMYMMSLMLLLREEGLDSCPQECWARYAPTVDRLISPPGNLMLFCGMSIGYADRAHPVNNFVSERTPAEGFAIFRGFENS